jgi:hypothetical protein
LKENNPAVYGFTSTPMAQTLLSAISQKLHKAREIPGHNGPLGREPLGSKT